MKMPHWPLPLWHKIDGNPASRTLALLEKMGKPLTTLPPTIHVAGTNGKGSTIAFLRAMFEAAGYAVHAYTPPHINQFNERILLAGKHIDDGFLTQVIEETRLAAGNEEYSFFEGTTAAAFLAFSHVEADILLLETGLGGRFDPTNVIEKPALTIITSIYYDHCEVLGKNLIDIAWHKAGIIKPDVPCIVSHQPAEIIPVLEKETSLLYQFGKHWMVKKTSDGMEFIDAHGTLALPRPALLGDHQLINAGNAIAAISALDDFDISADSIIEGLQNVEWPGRLERITATSLTLPANAELWFDGGHNESGGIAVADFIRSYWGDKKLFLLCGTTKGKDATAFLKPFAGLVDFTCGLNVEGEPDSESAEHMARFAYEAGLETEAFPDTQSAIDACIAKANGQDARILVFGSMYLRLQLV